MEDHRGQHREPEDPDATPVEEGVQEDGVMVDGIAVRPAGNEDLEVADHVDGHEAEEDEARDGHHHLATDRGAEKGRCALHRVLR